MEEIPILCAVTRHASYVGGGGGFRRCTMQFIKYFDYSLEYRHRDPDTNHCVLDNCQLRSKTFCCRHRRMQRQERPLSGRMREPARVL